MHRSERPRSYRPPDTSILHSDAFSHDDFGIREASTSNRSGPRLLSLGRVLNILLDAEPRELEKVRAQLKSRLQPKGSVGQAAVALIDHVGAMNSGQSSLEQIFVPILEHVVKSKETSNRKRAVCIIQLLLESEKVGVAAAVKLAAITWRHETNNRLKLGWCIVVREIVQAWAGQGSADSPLHSAAFATLVSCIPQLENLARSASVQEDNKKVPTRLSIVAADCMLAITKAIALGGITNHSDSTPKENLDKRQPVITPIATSPNDVRSDNSNSSDNSNVPSTSSRDLFSSSERRNMALWEQLDNLVLLVNELHEWNYRSRPLYAKGLQRVQNRLQSLAQYRDSLKYQQTMEADVSIGAEVLLACWQHYGGLLLTEDKSFHTHLQPILQHWLGALQYFMQENDDSNTEEETRKTQEMRVYSLACLALTLGKLDARRLETVLNEFEPQLLSVLFSQLRGGDTTIVELAVGILRAILFRPSLSAPESSTVSSASRLETVVPMLLDMLDKRDLAARAVVLLVAEYFAANPEAVEFEKLFSRLDAEDSLQRRNALDVLTELFSICTRNSDMINSTLSQTIATQLFKRLGDTELTNRAEASALFASLDPSFTLSTLVELIYSPDARVRSAASAGVLSVLKRRTDPCRVIAELLDCVAKFVKENQRERDSHKETATTGISVSDTSQVDVDRVMRLIPDWASKVEDWSNIIHLLLEKMFDEPANAVIPRFLSSISQQLAENTHILFPLLLKKFQEQSQLTEAFISKTSKDDHGAVASHLFERLSPLLVLRVLPLSAFNDRSCKELYGGLTSVFADNLRIARNEGLDADRADCITVHLLNRACGDFEFEDVRKVASEITGRLVPEIMLPLITAQLEEATKGQDILRVKACLYALCTSLALRAKDSVNHVLMGRIRSILSSILLWPCVVEEKVFSEVAKAQHGSIDCLALMVCAETQALKEPVADEDSHGLRSARGQPEVSEHPPKAEQPLVSMPLLAMAEQRSPENSDSSPRRPSPEVVEDASLAESNSSPSRPFLAIVEEPSSGKSKASPGRSLLEVVEEHIVAEEFLQDVGSDPPAMQGCIQLVEKLPESEQLKTRQMNTEGKVKKKLSGKRIKVLDRLTEFEEDSGEGFEETQPASDPATSINDVPDLQRNEQVGRGKAEDGRQQSPVKTKLVIEELLDLEQREEERTENLIGGETHTGFKQKVLIEELSESDLSRRNSVKGGKGGDHQSTVLVDVVDCLTAHAKELPWSFLNHDSEVSSIGGVTGAKVCVPVAYRICMANVLISACQKISLGGRTTVAAKMIPPLATFVQKSNDSKLKAACFQVLFTAVYHLKASAVLPFADDLMVLSLRTANSRAPFEERMGAAKLLASLLASEEVLVRELVQHLVDAHVALSSISAIDSSSEMRALCEQLLSCLSIPGEGRD